MLARKTFFGFTECARGCIETMCEMILYIFIKDIPGDLDQ